jgi:hypothetical protein
MFNGNGNANFDELKVIEAAENADQTGRRQLWERQVGESPKAYNAFVKYRDLAERRTMAKVAQELGCSSTNVERWARRWCWTQRTYAYDLVEEEKWREQASRDRVQMRRRQIALGQSLQAIGAHAVRELQSKIAAGTPLNIGPDEITNLLKTGADIEGRGMGGENASKFTRIVVNMGRHRYASEPCGCHCTACASCHGEGKDEDYEGMEVEGGDDPKKLN